MKTPAQSAGLIHQANGEDAPSKEDVDASIRESIEPIFPPAACNRRGDPVDFDLAPCDGIPGVSFHPRRGLEVRDPDGGGSRSATFDAVDFAEAENPQKDHHTRQQRPEPQT
jgi:hypothetical protein